MRNETITHQISYLDSRAEEILNLLNEGYQRKIIAQKLGVDYFVLSNWMARRDVRKVYQFGPNRYNLIEKNKQEILKLYNQGLSVGEIAKRFGFRNGIGMGHHLGRWLREDPSLPPTGEPSHED